MIIHRRIPVYRQEGLCMASYHPTKRGLYFRPVALPERLSTLEYNNLLRTRFAVPTKDSKIELEQRCNFAERLGSILPVKEICTEFARSQRSGTRRVSD